MEIIKLSISKISYALITYKQGTSYNQSECVYQNK